MSPDLTDDEAAHLAAPVPGQLGAFASARVRVCTGLYDTHVDAPLTGDRLPPSVTYRGELYVLRSDDERDRLSPAYVPLQATLDLDALPRSPRC